jgi:sec-independent protein translocase protein TatB
MNFFGMGPLELVVVLVLALVFIGPEKLPEVAAQLGKVYRDLRRVTAELSTEFNESMQEIQSIHTEVQGEVQSLQSLDLGTSEEPATAVGTPSDTVPSPVGAAVAGGAAAAAEEQSAATAVAVPYGPTADASIAARDPAALESQPSPSEQAPGPNGSVAARVPDDLLPPY